MPDISDLHPTLQPLCKAFLGQCKDFALDARLLFTYRSPALQDKLYAQGRTLPGRIVTNLRGEKSKHCYTIDGKPAAKAFDFGIFEDGKYVQNGSDKRYAQAAAIGEAFGMKSGIHWKVPFDPGHLEID